MVRKPDWSESEFEVLLTNSELSNEELVKKLPRRTVGAIEVVRSFIHAYHRGHNISGLSQKMLPRLERGCWTCAKCKSHFEGRG